MSNSDKNTSNKDEPVKENMTADEIERLIKIKMGQYTNNSDEINQLREKLKKLKEHI